MQICRRDPVRLLKSSQRYITPSGDLLQDSRVWRIKTQKACFCVGRNGSFIHYSFDNNWYVDPWGEIDEPEHNLHTLLDTAQRGGTETKLYFTWYHVSILEYMIVLFDITFSK